MQLVFHTGAHFTEEGRLMKCLLRNKDGLRARGVAVPGPGTYRKLLRETLAAMREAPPSEKARDVLLDAILDGASADRVVLSNANFFGPPRAALRRGVLYPQAPERIAHLAQLFRADQLEVFMAIRNPATFLPACFERSQRNTLDQFLDGADPQEIQWSNTFKRMRAAAPDVPITVWCNEDVPLLWSQIIREIGAMDHGEYVIGGFDILSDIMSPEGMERFVEYIKGKSQMTEIQIRRVMAAFLEKFALETEIEEQIDIPGWTHEMVQDLSETYEEDTAAIARIPGVTLIVP